MTYGRHTRYLDKLISLTTHSTSHGLYWSQVVSLTALCPKDTTLIIDLLQDHTHTRATVYSCLKDQLIQFTTDISGVPLLTISLHKVKLCQIFLYFPIHISHTRLNCTEIPALSPHKRSNCARIFISIPLYLHTKRSNCAQYLYLP